MICRKTKQAIRGILKALYERTPEARGFELRVSGEPGRLLIQDVKCLDEEIMVKNSCGMWVFLTQSQKQELEHNCEEWWKHVL